MKGDEIVRPYGRHSSGNMLPINTRENGWSNFSEKFENRGIKIAQVNSILITKYINLQLCTLILSGVGSPL